MDIITWIIVGVLGVFAVTTVILLMMFVMPTIKSPGRLFMEAKRKNKIVAFLDNGSHYIGTVCDRTEAEGFIKDLSGNMITVSPNSLKYCQGVMMGVGENHRSLLVNPDVVEMIDMATAKDIDVEKLKEAVDRLEKKLKQEGLYVPEKEKGNSASTDTQPAETDPQLETN